MRITLGHPDLEVEQEILTGRSHSTPPVLRPVTSLEQVGWLQQTVVTVHVAAEIARYVALLAAATRRHESLRLGVSTRGSLALVRAAQAYAAGAGRHYVVPDDVKATAGVVLTHRLILTAQAEVRGITAAQVLAEALDTVRIPAPVTA
jgi:MoxR-like ATPase